jgi:metallo-beta-lactamase class B
MNRILFCILTFAGLALAQTNPDWHRAFPAFKIAGNLYYVGTADLAVYLINTPRGNILINSDFPEDLPLIRKSIEQLGFKYRDTKIILISHAHSDHDEATGLIKKDTGAQLMVMESDVPEEESTVAGRPGAHVDRVLHDGDIVELGGSKLTAHLTPGHTKGCTTWTMQVDERGRKLNVVIVGTPGYSDESRNRGFMLVGNKSYPQIADDYLKTFRVLKNLPADLFLGAHGAYFGLKTKYATMRTGSLNPFIDPEGYNAYVAQRESIFLKEWEFQKKNLSPGTQ